MKSARFTLLLSMIFAATSSAVGATPPSIAETRKLPKNSRPKKGESSARKSKPKTASARQIAKTPAAVNENRSGRAKTKDIPGAPTAAATLPPQTPPLIPPLNSPPVAWTTHARRFTGESERVREHAIAELRQDPQLSEKLRKALGTSDHFLALDVISVLNLREFIGVLTQFSEKDRTGYAYHVLNSIGSSSDLIRLGPIYEARLASEKSSPAAKVALLDSLGRMQITLTPDALAGHLRHEMPEVRSAAIYYLRTAVLRWQNFQFLPTLSHALRDSTFQNRLQALYVISELPKEMPDAMRREVAEALTQAFGDCAAEKVSPVKTLCEKLRRSFPPAPAVATAGGSR